MRLVYEWFHRYRCQVDTKTCSKCRRELSIDNYYRDKTKKDGLDNQCKECNRAFDKANKEKIAKRRSIYLESNKEQVKAQWAKYRKDNPHKCHEQRVKRRSTLKNASDGTITKEAYESALQAHLEAHSNKCPFCTREYEPNNPVSLDHVVPLAKGGLHSMSNVQFMCKSCNSSKGAKNFSEWLPNLQTFCRLQIYYYAQ